MVQLVSTLIGLAGVATLVAAHPGHDVRAEAAERAAFLKRASPQARSLNHCAATLRARGIEKQNIARRVEAVKAIRSARGLNTEGTILKPRADDPLNTDHHSSLDVDQNTDPDVLFASNATCILGPDVTQGPYYVTGELIRSDITDGEPGVPLYLDIQLIDTNTCDPVADAFLDIWHCNSTGVYSGVVAGGNGDSSDSTNLDATFLRGIQKTDDSGVVQFETVFPGHYIGRATHIHLLSHVVGDVTLLENNTLSDLYSAHASHVGQLFFDQSLIEEVDTLSPYAANSGALTANDADMILAQEADVIDPFVQYVYLGEGVEEGIFAWISMGLDGTEETEVAPAVFYTEDGGVENDQAGGGPPF